MRGNPGVICLTVKEEKVVAFSKDQEKKFQDLGKVLVTYLNDDYTFVMDEGKVKKRLKSIHTLTIIGNWD